MHIHKGTLADIVDGGYGYGGYGYGGYGNGHGHGYGDCYGDGGGGGYGSGGEVYEIKPTEWIEILTEGEYK